MIGSDLQLRRHVEEELEWEPSINAAGMGVAVHDAVVTLSGTVESFAQKHAAGEVVAAIRGVRAVANELDVRLPVDAERDDDAIAHTIASIFSWNTSIPKDRLKVLVSQGWVTLEGTVDRHFQRVAAEDAVRGLMGVKGLTNSIVVKPVIQPPVPSEGSRRRSAEARSKTRRFASLRMKTSWFFRVPSCLLQPAMRLSYSRGKLRE